MITEEAANKINELIQKGWEFSLHHGEDICGKVKGITWEADFTKKKENGLWDNHESGYHKDNPSIAIIEAYDNIILGVIQACASAELILL